MTQANVRCILAAIAGAIILLLGAGCSWSWTETSTSNWISRERVAIIMSGGYEVAEVLLVERRRANQTNGTVERVEVEMWVTNTSGFTMDIDMDIQGVDWSVRHDVPIWRSNTIQYYGVVSQSDRAFDWGISAQIWTLIWIVPQLKADA